MPECTLTMHHIFLPIPCVLVSIKPCKSTFSIFATINEITNIIIPIRKHNTAIPMNITMYPLTFNNLIGIKDIFVFLTFILAIRIKIQGNRKILTTITKFAESFFPTFFIASHHMANILSTSSLIALLTEFQLRKWKSIQLIFKSIQHPNSVV